MFDWFWEFLYTISKTIFRLIDGLILCANKVCGIDTINFNGEENDFLSYLLFSGEVGFAFRITAVIAAVLVVIFAVFAIIRSITKDKVEGTPTQIAVKAFKTLLMFFFVPLVMVAFMTLGNTLVQAVYKATLQNASGPGAFLFSAFAIDGGMNADVAALFRSGQLDYTDTALVKQYIPIENFPFIFSWIAGGVALFAIGSAMLIFIDRLLSIVILYVASPVSISTSLIDDGARFKLWRDQFLTKFIMGYGMIVSINIYALVCGLVMKPGFAFFPDQYFLDLIMKLLIIAGGALTLQKSMALVGNLVSAGAGSNELRDNAFTAGQLLRTAAGVPIKAAGLAFSGLGKLNKMRSDLTNKLKASSASQKAMDAQQADAKKSEGSSGAYNGGKANYGGGTNAKNAISGAGFQLSKWPKPNEGLSNANSLSPESQNNKKNQNPLMNVINNNNPSIGNKEGGN